MTKEIADGWGWIFLVASLTYCIQAYANEKEKSVRVISEAPSKLHEKIIDNGQSRAARKLVEKNSRDASDPFARFEQQGKPKKTASKP